MKTILVLVTKISLGVHGQRVSRFAAVPVVDLLTVLAFHPLFTVK